MKLPKMTPAMIARFASSQSFERGEEYYYSGAVNSLVARGGTLQAEVQGSDYEPYRVQVEFGEEGVEDAVCSCPYDWGGWCKHIVAVLLACIKEPDELEERPSLEELLPRFSREQLEETIHKWSALHPELADFLESQAPVEETEGKTPKGKRRRKTAVKADTYSRKVSGILHSLDRMRSSEAYWEVGNVVEEVREVLGQARAFLDAGEIANALAVLEGITEAYVEDWIVLDDSDGYAGEFFSELGEAWTEAVLQVELSAAARKALTKKLDAWAREVSDYGVEDAFEPAAEAIRQGWDYPPLVKAMAGEITEKGAWEGEAPWYADDLAQARLKVLERQERYDEYLNLAQAEGQMGPYVLMLVKRGRIEEALEEGLQLLTLPDEILTVAQALEEQGAVAEALRLGRHGLDKRTDYPSQLKAWVRDVAARAGDNELALEAAIAACEQNPTLEAYRKAEDAAGENWPEVREKLLKHVKRVAGQSWGGEPVEILLQEGLIRDALNAVKNSANSALVGHVVDIALPHFPEDVIDICRRQAEPIMEKGQSGAYQHAARWLARAKEAYEIAGKADEWKAYLDDLMERHRRKYSLMPLLKELTD